MSPHRTHRIITIRTILRSLTVCVIAALWFFTSLTTSFFWTLFLVWAVWRLDPRIIGGGALALLILIPILLSTEDWAWTTETIAVWVYFLLCITVGLQIIEMAVDRRTDRARTPTGPTDTVPISVGTHPAPRTPRRVAHMVSEQWKTACSGVRTFNAQLIDVYRAWSLMPPIDIELLRDTIYTRKIMRMVAANLAHDMLLALCVVIWFYADPLPALFWTTLILGLVSGGNKQVVGIGMLILCIGTAVSFLVPAWAQYTDRNARYALFLLCTTFALYLVDHLEARKGRDRPALTHTEPPSTPHPRPMDMPRSRHIAPHLIGTRRK